MPVSAAAGALRQLLDERITQLLNDAERVAAEAGERARRETANDLNQAVRAMRQAGTPEDVLAALLDAASRFAGGVALFRIEGETARGDRVRGAAETAGDFRSLQIPLAQAPALASAVESRDPVITAADSGSISAALAVFLELPANGRASIFPVISGKSVVALAVAWVDVEGPAIELLAEAAGAVLSGMRPQQAATDLVSIAPAAPAEPVMPWKSLSPAEQRVHLRAQRFARSEVARIRLYYAVAVKSGRVRSDLYGELRGPIDVARASFRKLYFEPCSSMVDYLHMELVRSLAQDDPELLGENYPGVML